ncbi:MAG: hypothetical protein V1754_06295 [Pseudomonadota bacterium]
MARKRKKEDAQVDFQVKGKRTCKSCKDKSQPAKSDKEEDQGQNHSQYEEVRPKG